MDKQTGPKILLFDIETAPSKVYTWTHWDANVLATDEDWYVLCLAWQWYGDDEIFFARKAQKRGADKGLVQFIHKLQDEADIVVAHNGDQFDQKKMNARYLVHGLGPPSPFRQIDTLKEIKRHFKLYSNSLNEIGRYLDLGEKVKHRGIDLWLDCMAGDEDAWLEMETYNRRDVKLLADVFDGLSPWIGHPGRASPGVNMQQWTGTYTCTKPTCGSTNVVQRGYHRTGAQVYKTYRCRDCGGYSRALLADDGRLR